MAPAPVVGARFCAPHATAFTVTETASWPWRDFTVTKSGAAPAVMQVEASRGLFDCHRRSLFLDPRRGPLLTLVSRSLFGWRRWEAFRGDTADADLLFTADARTWMTSTPFPMGRVNVFLAASAARRSPDFRVSRRGLFGDRRYTVVDSRGGAAVAEIDHTSWPFAWVETYEVRVKAGVDHAFVLALAVILEELRHDEVRRNKAT